MDVIDRLLQRKISVVQSDSKVELNMPNLDESELSDCNLDETCSDSKDKLVAINDNVLIDCDQVNLHSEFKLSASAEQLRSEQQQDSSL